ncbi:MAG: tRNA pseudouridine(54/55) synthase Pus10 [Fervidicoccaceae archaeon]
MDVVLESSMNLMKKFPLCDSCLGRMFSTLLRGFSNEDRGRALKRAAVMELLARIKGGEIEAVSELKSIAPSLGGDFDRTFEEVGLEHKPSQCYICGGKIGEWISLYTQAVNRLKEVGAESFIVGVKVPKEVEDREEEVIKAFSMLSAESIKAELKREIGKRISASLGIPADFKNPGAVVLVDIESGEVRVSVNPIFVKGRYLKVGRNISQIRWFDEPEGGDSLSVEKMISSSLSKVYEGSEIVLHASGREDVDVRMLGSGRPFIIEIKNPRRRRANLKLISDLLNRSSPYGKFSIEGMASRGDVRVLKLMDSSKLKAYRVVAVSEEPLSESDRNAIEEKLKGAVVKQRTPLRVLRRRADIVRSKRIYDIKLKLVGTRTLVGILVADGGLYVKELVSGDEGRTVPSFSSLVGKKLLCAELDVVKVFI